MAILAMSWERPPKADGVELLGGSPSSWAMERAMRWTVASDRRVLGVLRLNGGVQALNRLDGARLEHAVGLGQGGGALP